MADVDDLRNGGIGGRGSFGGKSGDLSKASVSLFLLLIGFTGRAELARGGGVVPCRFVDVLENGEQGPGDVEISVGVGE